MLAQRAIAQFSLTRGVFRGSAMFSSTAKKAEEIANSAADIKHWSLREGGTPADKVLMDAKAVDPFYLPHSGHSLPHPIWDLKAVESVDISHVPPRSTADSLAYWSVRTVRAAFDLFTGYAFGMRGEGPWLRRIIFLETIAGVPGMVGGMIRHMGSLRRMERDFGWIHTLLEEAENERMHLMIALTLRKPGAFFRTMVLGGQGVFWSFYAAAYAISPKYCHRFVGYLEEEAVRTYTRLLQEIDKGNLPLFAHTPAPYVARDYYKLQDPATLRDVFLCIRADESHHRDVNHTFAGMAKTDPNPFKPGH